MQKVDRVHRNPRNPRGVSIWIVIAAAMVGRSAAFATESNATVTSGSTFQPEDISIGSPIALPFAKPSAQPTAGRNEPAVSAAVAGPAGWLGMSVAESSVPGRWTIVEVVPGGPAATAGIASGDELRGVNGRLVASADDVSQALTAITAGQRVQLTVARADQIRDVETVAVPRAGAAEAATGGREWQSSAAAPPPDATTPPPPGPATVSVLTNPAPTVPASAFAPPASTPPAIPPPATIAADSATVPSVATPTARGRTALGVRTVPIDRAIQERFRLPDGAGAYVIGVVGDLPASKAGIPPGSVIVSLADRPVRSPHELTQLVATGPTNRPVPVQYVLPGGTARRADVVLQSLELPLEQALVGDAVLQPATAPPTLEPGPTARTARRPETPVASEAGEIRREMGRLRSLLDALERRLDRLTR
jgi:membrane-associated protease RseP (regulator of RpoE activity)